MRYEVRERVVFEYVWRVDAESKEGACAAINDMGDGEAESHDECERRVTSVKEIGS